MFWFSIVFLLPLLVSVVLYVSERLRGLTSHNPSNSIMLPPKMATAPYGTWKSPIGAGLIISKVSICFSRAVDTSLTSPATIDWGKGVLLGH